VDSGNTFWAAFADETEKLAGIEQILLKAKGLISAGRAAAAPMVAKGTGMFAQSGAGRWLAGHPRISKVLGFGGGQMLTGGAFAAGGIPFQRRRKIIHVLPEEASEDMLLRQYRRKGGY